MRHSYDKISSLYVLDDAELPRKRTVRLLYSIQSGSRVCHCQISPFESEFTAYALGNTIDFFQTVV